MYTKVTYPYLFVQTLIRLTDSFSVLGTLRATRGVNGIYISFTHLVYFGPGN